MSSKFARREMDRFLSSSEPEVLSVSGRWGVGKTYGWNSALRGAREAKTVPMTRYAYVSAFGVKSLVELKTAIFQSTVRLDRADINPTLDSFRENIGSLEGLGALAERGGRRVAKVVQGLVSAIPWAGSAADLLLPSAALLIRDQIVCIDDLERSGDGLSISDILGFVSSLREEKSCKIVLLLNEEGLGEDRDAFNTYLEKVVDQAIKYTPTPQESAAVALDLTAPIDENLAQRTIALGISNIRVIKRLRRFVGQLEPVLHGLNGAVLDQAISTIALLGWSIFEPRLAPSLQYLQTRSDWTAVLAQESPSAEEAAWNALLQDYGFVYADEMDVAILDGLQSGAFDQQRIRQQAELLDEKSRNSEERAAIRAPWDILGNSFEDNQEQFLEALITSVHRYAYAMSPGDLNGVVTILKDLGQGSQDDLIELYMREHENKPRQFFELHQYHTLHGQVDPAIRAAFADRLSRMPLSRDAAAILIRIEEQSGWNPDDIEFLASLSEDQYYEMFKAARGQNLRSMLRSALRFVGAHGTSQPEQELGRKAVSALRRIGAENPLNALRVLPYIPKDPPTEA